MKKLLIFAAILGNSTHLMCMDIDDRPDWYRLVQHSSDPDAIDFNGTTPLGNAVFSNDLKKVSALLDPKGYAHPENVSKPAINKKDLHEDTPLHRAVSQKYSKNNLSMLTLLLKHGADVNKKNGSKRTPLHVAAAMGKYSAVTFLLDHGAAINAKDLFGNTPLEAILISFFKNSAESEKRIKTMIKLLDIGENPKLTDLYDAPLDLTKCIKNREVGKRITSLLESYSQEKKFDYLDGVTKLFEEEA